MGNAIKAVKSFVIDVGKFVVKKGVSFVGGKIPIVGGWIADRINDKIGGRFANGGKIGYMGGDGSQPEVMINNLKDLMKLVKKYPEIAVKYGITIPKIMEYQEKYSADEKASQTKTSLETGKDEVKREEDDLGPNLTPNPVSNKQLALKKGGVMMAKGGMAKCAKGGSVGIKKTNPWLEHVKAFRATAKGKAMSYSDALKSAKLTYKKM
jgi:hypothetical protein